MAQQTTAQQLQQARKELAAAKAALAKQKKAKRGSGWKPSFDGQHRGF